MSTHYRPIQKVDVPIELACRLILLLQGGPHLIPNPRFPPAAEAAMHTRPTAVAFWQVTPRRTCPQNPQHPIQHGAMIAIGPPRVRLFRWQQRLHSFPLSVSQFMSVHTCQYNWLGWPRHSELSALLPVCSTVFAHTP